MFNTTVSTFEHGGRLYTVRALDFGSGSGQSFAGRTLSGVRYTVGYNTLRSGNEYGPGFLVSNPDRSKYGFDTFAEAHAFAHAFASKRKDYVPGGKYAAKHGPDKPTPEPTKPVGPKPGALALAYLSDGGAVGVSKRKRDALADLRALIAERDTLVARVAELEAEQAKRAEAAVKLFEQGNEFYFALTAIVEAASHVLITGTTGSLNDNLAKSIHAAKLLTQSNRVSK